MSGCPLISLGVPGDPTSFSAMPGLLNVRLPAGTKMILLQTPSLCAAALQPSLLPCTEEALAPSAVCGCQEQTGIVSLLESFQKEKKRLLSAESSASAIYSNCFSLCHRLASAFSSHEKPDAENTDFKSPSGDLSLSWCL